MLARARDTLPPPGLVPDALWQQKIDGYRVIAYLRSGTLLLQSRRGADLSAAFPELAAAAAGVRRDLVLDGELVVLHGGRLDFGALQHRTRRGGRHAADAAAELPANVVVFDLLEADGEVLLARPYRERWSRLRELFEAGVLGPPWALVSTTADREAAAEWLDPAWGRVGVEGVVVKDAGQRYHPGERRWWKVRAYESAEAVVGAVTGTPDAPETLLLGRPDAAGVLRLTARTTPLSTGAARELGAVLRPGGRGHPWHGVRFSVGWGSREELEFTTVRPDTVAEFRADAAVDAGRQRHPVRFLRIRRDMGPDDVPAFGGPAGPTAA